METKFISFFSGPGQNHKEMMVYEMRSPEEKVMVLC